MAVGPLDLPVAMLRTSAGALLGATRIATFPARVAGRITFAVAEELLELLERASLVEPARGVRAPGAAPVPTGPATGTSAPSAGDGNAGGNGVQAVRPAAVRSGKRRASTPGIAAGADLSEPVLPHEFDPERRRASRRPRPASAPAPPPTATPTPAPDEPDTPARPREPEHVDSEIELVAESADPGASEGAGAAIRVDPPWPGYTKMKAADVIDRLAAADEPALSVLLLFEHSHRKRRSVIQAAERELTRRSTPAAR